MSGMVDSKTKINLITLADTVRVIWTAETKWNQIVTENPNKNV